MQDVDPFEFAEQHELEELSEAVRDEDARLYQLALKPLHMHIGELSERVQDRTCVGVVVLDASDLGVWERQHGAASFRTLMSRMAVAVDQMRGHGLRTDDIICFNADEGEQILIFLASPRADDGRGPSIDFESIVSRLKRSYFAQFESSEWWFRQAIEKIAVGSALIIRNETVEPRREIYRAMRTAQFDAQVSYREVQRQRHRVVGHMIAQRKITTLYQPIVDIQRDEIVGYEALSRAEPGDAERLGVHLFVAAARAELDGELDQTCRSLSIRRRPMLNGTGKLFVNSLPPAFYQPMTDLEMILEAWEADGLKPGQLVFEITENITHDQLHRILPTINALRQRGYLFAVDDVGTGAANLQLLTDIEPDYIKMDISLTRGIAGSERRQALATYLLELADRFDAELIAEGIENQADHETLKRLGVTLGQGFLLGRPQSFERLS